MMNWSVGEMGGGPQRVETWSWGRRCVGYTEVEIVRLCGRVHCFARLCRKPVARHDSGRSTTSASLDNNLSELPTCSEFVCFYQSNDMKR